MIVRPWCPLLFAGMVCAASTADAQGESRTTSSTEIESEIGPLLASGDSGAALSVLGRTIAREPGNASAWFRQGEIALLLARPRGTGFEWSARSIRHMRLADSSLKVATMLAPDSARYQMVRAMYFLAGELPMVREGASKSFHLGLAAAER
ncbi:MAG TPA: hypothetical protein VK922_02960, partial [Gemmatimonadaceae bacterium]|nr:hypothetical protein [Gemmatimonadaceae bacterium]